MEVSVFELFLNFESMGFLFRYSSWGQLEYRNISVFDVFGFESYRVVSVFELSDSSHIESKDSNRIINIETYVPILARGNSRKSRKFLSGMAARHKYSAAAAVGGQTTPSHNRVRL